MKFATRSSVFLGLLLVAGYACATPPEAWYVGKPVEATLIGTLSGEDCETGCVEVVDIRGAGRFHAIRGRAGKYVHISKIEKGGIFQADGTPITRLNRPLVASVDYVLHEESACASQCALVLAIEGRGKLIADILNGRVAYIAPLTGEDTSITSFDESVPSTMGDGPYNDGVPTCGAWPYKDCKNVEGGLTGSPGNITGSTYYFFYYDRNGFLYKIVKVENGKTTVITYEQVR